MEYRIPRLAFRFGKLPKAENDLMSLGTDPIKITFSVILHYAGFDLSDWLKILEQPKNALK